MTGGRAFVHLGLQKTGTSYLQSHLWDDPEELAAQGVRMVPDTRGQAFQLQKAVVERTADLAHPKVAARALDRLAELVPRLEQPTLLVSQESLAGATAEQAARLRACFTSRELHLVVTVRDVARQLPSLWQQRVKARADCSFPEFLELVQDGRGVGATFWKQQDLPAVLGRWQGDVPPERVHVVTVPPPGAAADELPRRFGSVVGIDFARLRTVDARRNVSLDPAQVELLRRVNALGTVESRAEHARAVKQLLAAQVLAPLRGEPARTPRELAGWCGALAEEQVAFLRRQGYAVAGDLEDLLPVPSSFGDAAREVDESDVARAAVAALAELAVRHHRLREQLADAAQEDPGTDEDDDLS